MLETRYTLMDEEHFWLYYLHVNPGPAANQRYRLTNADGSAVALPAAIDLLIDLQGGGTKCIIKECGGRIVHTRLVDIRITQ